ncbi:MAG: hypothetical protein AAF488_05720 [Planctomycetota bacterium]
MRSMTLLALAASALITVGCTGNSSSSVAEASVNLGPIQDCDVFIVLPDGRIDHFDSELQFIGSLTSAPAPGANCMYGLLQDRDRLVLVENCIVDGTLTQEVALAIGLNGQILDGDFSDIDCAVNCPVLKFDFGTIPSQTFQGIAIEGALSDGFFQATGDELQYFLRLDGFFDGDPDSEVTFGGDLLFEEFADDTARLTGSAIVNSVNGGPVPQELIDSGEVGPFDVSVLFRKVDGSEPDFRYYEIVPVGREMVNVNDIMDSVNLISFPLDGAMPFQVGVGANGHNDALGAAGWLNFEHIRFHEEGIEIFGCLGDHLYDSDFLMDLVEVSESATP